jgi:long-chain acyl-CoA synthetase
MRPFQAGVGLLAKNLAIPVVPIRIDGLFELKKAGRKFARPGQIQIKIGTPVQFPRDSDPAWIARELQSKVEQL